MGHPRTTAIYRGRVMKKPKMWKPKPTHYAWAWTRVATTSDTQYLWRWELRPVCPLWR